MFNTAFDWEKTGFKASTWDLILWGYVFGSKALWYYGGSNGRADIDISAILCF